MGNPDRIRLSTIIQVIPLLCKFSNLSGVPKLCFHVFSDLEKFSCDELSEPMSYNNVLCVNNA